jgi:hypothetical protein
MPPSDCEYSSLHVSGSRFHSVGYPSSFDALRFLQDEIRSRRPVAVVFSEDEGGCLTIFEFSGRHFWPRQIDSPTSPSSTDVFNCGRSPVSHSEAVCSTRYRIGPPSGLSLRVMGRGMQTNSVRISSPDNWTFA